MKEAIHRKRILIISHDKIGTKMAGPGIRYHYMAEALSDSFDVTVGFFDPTYLPDKNFKHSYEVKSIDANKFESAFKEFEIVTALYLTSSMLYFCNMSNIFVVLDLYAPVPVENLAVRIFGQKKIDLAMDHEYIKSLDMYRQFFENGDLFLCSNQRQLDYWIGYVFGSGLIKPSTYQKRPVYDRFIYAPMGIDSSLKLTVPEKSVMKGILPGIKKTDKVVLWTGGIWDWFDGLTLIKAMDILKTKDSSIKLVFLGTQHPNSSIPEMSESLQSRKLADKLNLTNKSVFFKDGWVNYDMRMAYLVEADLAIYTHKPSIETEFSHRTRVLDHILAELPTVATEGDYFADDVISNKLGVVCPPDNPLAIADAILYTLEPKNYARIKKNLHTIRPDYDWAKTLGVFKAFLKTQPKKLSQLPSSMPAKRDKPTRRLLKKVLPTSAKKALVTLSRKIQE